MKRGSFTFGGVMVLASILLAVPLAVAGEAEETPLRINWTGQGGATGSGEFTLLGANANQSDSGTLSYGCSFGTEQETRDGQSFSPVQCKGVLRGTRGTLVLRGRGREVEAGQGYEAWNGKWSIVSGTGTYAGRKGDGGFVAVIAPGLKFTFQFEGYSTGP